VVSHQFDVVVVGLGAAGSATFFELAKRGARVLGIEQFYPGHDRGSSHGESRIFRLSYFEHPSYVPLLLEARRRWVEMDSQSSEKVFLETGSLEIGFPGAEIIVRSLEASRKHALVVDEMSATDIRQRFPAFNVPDDWSGHFQPDGGLLIPEAAVRRYVDAAVRLGGTLAIGKAVRRIDSRANAVEIDIEGERITADSVVVAAGAWLGSLLSKIRTPLEISRQVVGWFRPLRPSSFTPRAMPVFLLAAQDDAYYGFPDHKGSGLKAASHIPGRRLPNAEALRQDSNDDDEAQIRHLLNRYIPDGNGPLVRMQTCMYTNTPDGHFLIDRAEHDPRIIIASACSGHGFKFAPVLGEILADMAECKTPGFPIEGFAQDARRRLPAVPRLV
jgi:sarcosine oxidase